MSENSKNKKTDTPHNTRMSELFGNKEAFISFIKDCVSPEWADNIDEDSLRACPTEYVLQDFKKKRADCVYEAKLKNKQKIFFILLESQSSVDFRMGYRLLLYVVEILRKYYNNADKNERDNKDFKFPVVIPLVFYTGGGSWTVAQNLNEMFEDYELFGDFVVNFNYGVVNAQGYTGEMLKDFRSKLLKIVMVAEQAKTATEVLEAVNKYIDEVLKLSDEEKRILLLMLEILNEVRGGKSKYNFRDIIFSNDEKEAVTMLSQLITNTKDYEQNLIKKGARENAEELAREMLTDGKPMHEIIKYSKLTEKEIRKIAQTLKLQI